MHIVQSMDKNNQSIYMYAGHNFLFCFIISFDEEKTKKNRHSLPCVWRDYESLMNEFLVLVCNHNHVIYREKNELNQKRIFFVSFHWWWFFIHSFKKKLIKWFFIDLKKNWSTIDRRRKKILLTKLEYITTLWPYEYTNMNHEKNLSINWNEEKKTFFLPHH